HLVPGGPQDRLHHLELGVRVVHDHHLAHPELKPPLGTRPRPCETGGGCATDLPSRLAVRRWLYFKENATAVRLHGPKSLRRSRSSLESRDNFARSPDTLACEALNDACPTARTLDFRSPRSLAGILNAPVTYGLHAIPESGGRGAAAGDHRRHVPSGRPLPRCRALRRGRRAGDRKSTLLNSSHVSISYAVFC